MPRKYKDFTTAEEFEAFVNDFEWSESEIGDISDYDDDSLDDPDFNIVTNNDANITDQLKDYVFENGNELDAEQVVSVEPTAVESVQNEDIVVTGDSTRWHQIATFYKDITIDKDSSEFKKCIWKKNHMQNHASWVQFGSDSELTTEIMALDTPFKFFSYFVNDDIISNIVGQSNLYAIQKDSLKPLNTTPDEIKRFFGITYFMSVFKYPSIRTYWGEFGIPAIMNTMTRNRYDKVRQFLHLNDNSKMPRPSAQEPAPSRRRGLRPQNTDSSNIDRLYKIRPLIDALNRNFDSVPKRSRLCVDEQICATKIKHYLKQYLPDKPHPWGNKLFLMCDDMGFCYNFEIYSGNEDHVLENEPDLGAAANVVVRLARRVPRFKNYRIFFDNYYTTIPLLAYLRTQGIYGLGTVRRNRIPGCKLPEKLPNRGDCEEYMTSIHGIDITTIAWRDNKVVNMASTLLGIKQLKSTNANDTDDAPTIARFDKKNKCNVNIQCPAIIHEYNKYMGGVDLMDSCFGRSRIRIKSRKWTNRLIYHMMDMAMINAWILYKRQFSSSPRTNNMLTLHEFIVDVSKVLVKSGTQSIRKGRPRSTGECETPENVPKRVRVVMPPSDVRFDNVGHFPKYLTTGKPRCKMPNCTSRTTVYCIKCEVELCFQSTKNCFLEYHTKH